MRNWLIKALFLPHFDYCSVVYDDITAAQGLRLQRAFNAGVRFVTRRSRFDRVSEDRRQLGHLSLYHRRRYFLACVVFQLLLMGEPSFLRELFQLRAMADRRAGNRRSDLLVVPFARTATFQKSFAVVGATLLNSLPAAILNAQSVTQFKNLVLKLCMEADHAELALPV